MGLYLKYNGVILTVYFDKSIKEYKNKKSK